MSYAAISAALMLDADVSGGERLAAFALASFANREHRAWPSTRVAAARAGLSRSQFLAARESLAGRGLLAVEQAGGGRGNSPVVFLAFVPERAAGELRVNASLFEAVLSYSRARGPARLLLATLAALANEDCLVSDVTTDERLKVAAIADSTYRRARASLLATEEVELESVGGGRARTNRWLVLDPRSGSAEPLRASVPRPRPAAARPLLAANPGRDRTLSDQNGPIVGGVLTANPGQDRTVSPETPLDTPPETPPPHVRAGRESQNQRTNGPPSPPGGGSTQSPVKVVEDFVSDKGRRRRRIVEVPLEEAHVELRLFRPGDSEAWIRIRTALLGSVGPSTFEVWFAGLSPVGFDAAGRLLLSSPPATRAWLTKRFARVLDRAGDASPPRASPSRLIASSRFSKPSPRPLPIHPSRHTHRRLYEHRPTHQSLRQRRRTCRRKDRQS